IDSTIDVAEADLTAAGVAVATVEGKQFSGTVATFTDAGSPDGLGNYTAQIDWGDGQTSAGQVSQTGAGAFSVDGVHLYDEENPARAVRTTITERNITPPVVVVARSRAVIADAPIH